MKNIKAFLLLIFFVASFNLFAQTPADAIIGDYFKAIGGRDKVAAINSIIINGTVDVMGNSSPNKITILNGKGYKSEMNFGGQTIVQAITDKGGWMINPFMGSSEAAPLPPEQYNLIKDQIFIGGPLLNYMNNGSVVKFTGIENVDERPVYKIEVSSPDSVTTTFFIDSATHFLDERSISAAGQTTVAKYSDYRNTDAGIMMAYAEEITVPQATLNYTIDSITFNQPLDASFFDMPKQ